MHWARTDMAGRLSKKALRTELRERLRSFDRAVMSERSTQAAERLAETPEFRRAEAVMIFLPLRDEIDARPVALRAWQSAKVVTVPLVSHAQKHMIPLVIRSLDDPMDVDAFGLRAPMSGEPYPVELIDLVVVPGLGFDLTGHRLGRGGGFYDRFLAQPGFAGDTCGLAFDEQVVDQVPAVEHDWPVDMLVTDRRVVRFEQRD